MISPDVISGMLMKLSCTLFSVDYCGWDLPPNSEEAEAFSDDAVVLDVLEYYGDSVLYGMLARVVRDKTTSRNLTCWEAILRTISCNSGLALFMLQAKLCTSEALEYEKLAADHMETLIGVAYRACGRKRMSAWAAEVFGPLVQTLESEYSYLQTLEPPKSIQGQKRARQDEDTESLTHEDLPRKKRRKNVDKENILLASTVDDRSRRLAHTFPTSQFNFRAPSSRVSTERESYNSNRSLLDRIAMDTPPVLHIRPGGNSNSTAPSGSTRKTQLGQINGGYLSLLERLGTEDLMPTRRPPRISVSRLSLVAKTLEVPSGALSTSSSPRDIANMTIRQSSRGHLRAQPTQDQHGTRSGTSSCTSMATQSARFSAPRARGRSAAPLQEIGWAARLALGNHLSNRTSRPFRQ
ncbi:hypothetical protein Hypma_009664 [Hypsizygus marmoreus]|uniref:RNase III domain-containing protein n=1 Tax=Hypsizygus marmoreus TaxID=39966 RepID=A0A369JSA8_HYPMA|nr:hypothetical protein Hypma_009664 [Hypsizygus marmoreus]